MKNRILVFITLTFAIFSCEEENKVEDPIYEFASFKGTQEVSINELENSESAYPMVVQLYAFKPYPDDIELSLEVTGNNTVENVDFTVTPQTSVKIRAGSLVSDTIFINTIDNASGSLAERSFNIRISAISNPDIKIGLGIADPKNATVKVIILDDECSGTPLCIFNTAMTNTIGGTTVNPVEVVFDKDNSTITFSGDLMDYDVFPDATLTLTLTPDSEGATTGSATFGEQETGTDQDGYEYKFVEVGEGSFDATTGTISIEYDVYYMDAGSWVYWYTTTNQFAVP